MTLKKMKSGASISRRNFFLKSSVGVAAASSLPLLMNSCSTPESMKVKLDSFFSRDDVLLFQGDSITDAGRQKKRGWVNHSGSMGGGYAFLIASRMLEMLPDKNLSIYNRGISGNKVFQLKDRWQTDCLELSPNVLSILIGVNDYWHKRQGRYEGTVEVYDRDLRELLDHTREEIPGIKIMLCQPFILDDTSAVDKTWIAPFAEYQDAARKIAKDFDCTWVPFQESFDAALSFAEAKYWAHDGVHPSIAGAQLMANTWLESM